MLERVLEKVFSNESLNIKKNRYLINLNACKMIGTCNGCKKLIEVIKIAENDMTMCLPCFLKIMKV